MGPAAWHEDPCGNIWGTIYQTGALVFPPLAVVLEIGCAEWDWMTPMLAVRPDLQIIGLDWRPVEPPRRGAAAVLRGDVLSVDIPANTFDAIVCISSIEHIGLGRYAQDPIDPEGDRHCAERIGRWLKPGGWFYADVPYGSAFCVQGTKHRIYDKAAVKDRLVPPPLQLERSWHVDHVIPYVALLARKPASEDSCRT